MSNIKDFIPQENTGGLKIPQRGRAGRPKGSLNKPKEGEIAVVDRVKAIYKVIQHMLTPEQRNYYDLAFSGKVPYDPMKHAEFLAILYGVYANDVLLEAIENKVVSQDIAQTLREYRMALKELDDMKNTRKKEQERQDEQLADPTRESSQSRIDEIIERASKNAERRVSRRTLP